jgi:hypothetical protein
MAMASAEVTTMLKCPENQNIDVAGENGERRETTFEYMLKENDRTT